ncbi:LCP2 [Symbiodinium sp. KB8]|nr:LCP2 [Symbiodinium sp. KB8]
MAHIGPCMHACGTGPDVLQYPEACPDGQEGRCGQELKSPPLADVTPCEGQPARDGEGQNTCLPARIENRAWRIPEGWYAIHSGSQHINEDRAARIRAVWPEAPPEDSLPHGAILGLFYVHSHTTPQGCVPGYVWARGPICHVISKAVELLRPVHCRGGKGLWDLEAWQIQQIQQQFTEISIRVHDLSEVLPPGSF